MTKITYDVTSHPLNLFNHQHLHDFITHHLEEILIFDIETTGLHHQHCEAILIGYLYVKNGKIYAEQLFAENPEEEVEVLEAFKIISKSFSYHLSYNGNSFDIPFLNSRFKRHNIDYTLDKSLNIDLLRVARKLSKSLNLENYRLKTVEAFLGIHREDLISGKESVDLYNQYVISPSKALRKTILLHNFEDILYLGKVVDLLAYQDSQDFSNIPLMFCINKKRYYIKEHKIVKDFFTTKIFSRDLIQKRMHFSPGQLTLEQVGNVIHVKAPIFSITIDHYAYNFLDIDLISDNKISFNALSYEEKMQWLVDDSRIKDCLKILFTTIKTF